MILSLAQKESCVIVGRLANYILKDLPNTYHVFISADAASEAARAAVRDHLSPTAAAAKVQKVNHERAVHCRHFTKTEWGNARNYDLCIKSDDFGVEDNLKNYCGTVSEENEGGITTAYSRYNPFRTL